MSGPTRDAPQPRLAGIPLGRIAGFRLSLTVSWVILAGIVTVLWGAMIGVGHPELSPPVAYLVGLGMVAGLLVSVLLHELGHAFTARRFGIGVRGITLQMLGGYTELDGEAPSPGVEAVVALVGPAVSLGLGLLAGLVSLSLPSGGLAVQVTGWLAVGNLVVAAYNVLPGLPLDGGRALRAAVWGVTRNPNLADRVAGWGGRVVAVGTVLVGVALYLGPTHSWISLVVAFVVAYTLWTGASQAIQFGQLGVRLPMVNAGRLAHPLFPVPTGTPLGEAQRRYREARHAPGAPAAVLAVVNSAGHLLGIVNDAALAAVPADRRPWVSVDTVAAGLNRGPDPARPVECGWNSSRRYGRVRRVSMW